MNIKIERSLRKDMSHRDIDLDPVEHQINPDAQRHYYDVFVNGKTKRAFYLAFYDQQNNGDGFLVCSYGLVDEGPQYTYSSLQD